MTSCWIDRLKFRRISTNPKSMCNLWSLQPTNIFFTSIRQMILKFMWLNDCLDLLFCLVAKSYLTLCDPMSCSLPGSFVHGTSQASILEWVAISLSRGSSLPRDRIHVSCVGRQILYHWDSGKVHSRLGNF